MAFITPPAWLRWRARSMTLSGPMAVFRSERGPERFHGVADVLRDRSCEILRQQAGQSPQMQVAANNGKKLRRNSLGIDRADALSRGPGAQRLCEARRHAVLPHAVDILHELGKARAFCHYQAIERDGVGRHRHLQVTSGDVGQRGPHVDDAAVNVRETRQDTFSPFIEGRRTGLPCRRRSCRWWLWK